jgi:hypothetical protein
MCKMNLKAEYYMMKGFCYFFEKTAQKNLYM